MSLTSRSTYSSGGCMSVMALLLSPVMVYTSLTVPDGTVNRSDFDAPPPPESVVRVTHCLGLGGAGFATVSVIERPRPSLVPSAGCWAITVPGTADDTSRTVVTFQSNGRSVRDDSASDTS